jgi:hypothetical protein
MFKAVLALQWRSSRVTLLVLLALAVALPFASLALAQQNTWTSPADLAFPFISALNSMSPLFAGFAWGTGGLLAVLAWRDDFATKHLYSLVLPVPRWYFLLLRMSAGLLFIDLVTVALFSSSLLTVAQLTVPPGLHAYPGGFAVRYALAASVAFVVIFAMGSASERVLKWVGIAIATIAAASVLFAAIGIDWSPIGDIVGWFVKWPGMLNVFAGRWVLIDV